MKTHSNLLDRLTNAKPLPVLSGQAVQSGEDHGAQPFVFSDADILRETRAWTPEFVERQLGETPVSVWVSATGMFPGGRGPYDPKQYLSKQMPLSECMSRMRGVSASRFFNDKERYFLYQASVGHFEELVGEIDMSRYLREEVLSKNFWLSGPGNITPIHYDLFDNFLVQLMGHKRVLLWAPSHYSKLQFNPIGTTHDRVSRVDPTRRDDDAAREVENLSVYVHDLLPGDVLYIPFAWPHFVFTQEFSASVNFWWNPRAVAQLLRVLPQTRSPGEAAALIRQHLGTQRPELLPMLAGLVADGSLPALMSRMAAGAL
jgi:hypothetical protein